MERKTYYDFLRGIAIIMVVAIHMFRVDETNMHDGIDLAILSRQIMNCAVPIFLAISGFFLSGKLLDTTDNRIAFWKKQMPKVYVPVLIASLPYLVLSLSDGNNPFISIIATLTCAYSVYYFVALILQYYMLLPLLQKVNIGGVILSSVISFSYIAVFSYFTFMKGYHLPLIVYAGPFPVWILFFCLGCYLRKCKRTYSLLCPLLFTLLGVVLMYAETYYWQIGYGEGIGIKASSFFYSASVIWLLFSKRLEDAYTQNILTKGIAYIGRVSFAIYLYHLHAAVLSNRISFDFGNPFFNRTVLCLVVSLIFVGVVKYILPKKFHWLFGL